MRIIPVKKAAAVAAVFSMSLSFAACGMKTGGEQKSGEASHSGNRISVDSPWYESEITEITPDVDTGRKLTSSHTDLAGADDSYIVFLTRGYFDVPENFDWEKYNNRDFELSLLTVVDRNTKQTINSLDLIQNIKNAEYIESAEYDNGSITVTYGVFDELNENITFREANIDPLTGTLTDDQEFPDDRRFENSFKIGEYKVGTTFMWDKTSYYGLSITGPGGEMKKAVIRDPQTDFYDIPVILSAGDNMALIPAGGEDGKHFYELDLETGSITPLDGADYEWLGAGQLSSVFPGSEGISYFMTSSGIEKIDVKNRSVDTAFDFSWCGVNRHDLADLDIADFSEDSILLCGDLYSSGPYSMSDKPSITIVDMTKAQNPNAGKTVLELYAPDGCVDGKIGDAILKFNRTNSEYYIEVTDRYGTEGFFDENQAIDSEDDYDSFNLTGNSKISNALAMDIMNGEGPDILMNCGSYGQLNNPDYLADLTPYVGDLDPEMYFTNIIEGAGTDGKLFQLPVCFTVDGIRTSPEYAGASGTGFTTEEYEDFLNNVLNGHDVIPSGQAYYFAKIFGAMSDSFIVDGKADFSVPEFSGLAGFVKNNVPESAVSWNSGNYGGYYDPAPATDNSYDVEMPVSIGDMAYSGENKADYVSCGGMSSYISGLADGKDETVILGIPSVDGRGPVFTPVISVAVSANARNIGACAGFVKLLLSDDVQQSLAMDDYFVLNRAAFRLGGKAAVDYYNGEGGVDIFGYDYVTGKPMANSMVFSDRNIDDMENNILNCSKMNSADAAVSLILIEEMPPYFMGQKELPEVVAIAQDRVQKVLDERK